jgi:hypothetical protein
MYDYSYVLGLLRANAADLERRALSGERTKIARMVTERTLSLFSGKPGWFACLLVLLLVGILIAGCG